jgi:hypothetical protein
MLIVQGISLQIREGFSDIRSTKAYVVRRDIMVLFSDYFAADVLGDLTEHEDILLKQLNGWVDVCYETYNVPILHDEHYGSFDKDHIF